MNLRLLALFLLSFSAPAGAEADADSSPAAGPPTPAQVRTELEAVCAEIHATYDPYYGRAQVPKIREVLARGGLSPAQRVEAQSELAEHLSRLGEPKQATALLNETLQLAQRAQLPKGKLISILARLGLAAMRMGEVTNCVGMHTPGMCLLPIGPAGRHRDPQGSQLAMQAFEGVLAGVPDYPMVPWLLNIAAMTVGRYPEGVAERYRVPASRMRSSYDVGHFPDVAAQAGLHITANAGGGVMDDFDGDGLFDIVTSSAEPCAPMRFFRNDGRGGFEDLSLSTGLDSQLGALNFIHADVDGDGDLDLFVLRAGWMGRLGRIRNSLLRNDSIGAGGQRRTGPLTFTDVTAQAGLDRPAYPTQTAAWADADLDGDLDLFIGNEGETPETGYPSQLFRNDGPGADGTVRFTDIAEAAGVRNLRYAKSVAWGDVDNDGDPDLYVSNFGPNRLYRNHGVGAGGAVTFTDVAPELGLTEPAGQSFGSWFFDYDNDGHLDLLVTSYEAGPDVIADYFLRGEEQPSAHPRLYHNLGGGRFREVSAAAGLTQPSAPMGHNFGDLDNDGFLDFYLGTGWPQYESLMPNLMYRNEAGKRFVDVTYSGGFGHLQKGHGVAFGDLYGDGDQEVFEEMGGAYPGDAFHSALYENPGHGNAWLKLRLVGQRANRSALGARIRVRVRTPGGRREIHRVIGAGGSFGGSPLRAEIGLGDATAIEEVEIRWPVAGGSAQTLGGLQLNSFYEIRENAAPREIPLTRFRLGGQTP